MGLEVGSYIKQQLQNGVPEEQVKNQLIARGWKTEDIEEAFVAQKQAAALEQIKILKATSQKPVSHMKTSVVILMVVLIVLVVGMYFFVEASIKNNSAKPKLNTPQTSSASTSQQPNPNSSELSLQQNAQNSSRENDVAKLAAAAADFISNNNGQLPSSIAAGSAKGWVQLCGKNCQNGQPATVRLDNYQASDITFKVYRASLKVPDVNTVYIVPQANCNNDSNGVGTGIGPASQNPRSIVFLYAIKSSGLEQRCVSE